MTNICSRRSVLAIVFSAVVLLQASTLWAGSKYPLENEGLKSQNGDAKAQITFENYSGQKLKFYWLDYTGKPVFYASLENGESYTQDTYLTHPWLVTDADDNAWETYMPTEEPQIIAIDEPEEL